MNLDGATTTTTVIFDPALDEDRVIILDAGTTAQAVAACAAANLTLDERALSILARLGSGSACRSIPAGFVEWHAGEDSETSYAETIAPPEHWDLRDLIAIVQTAHKDVGSTTGQ